MAEREIPMKVLANPLRIAVCRTDRTPQIDKTLCSSAAKKWRPAWRKRSRSNSKR